MADEIAPVSSVSSSSSSSSTQSTNTSNNTQSTSESSSSSSTSSTSESSSSSSSTSSSEKSPEINTSDSSNISHEASEADEAEDGSSLNMSWMNGEEENVNSSELKGMSPEEANKKSGQITADYAKQFEGQKTYEIAKSELPNLQKYSYDNNCANFASSILEQTGRFEGHDNSCMQFKQHLLEQGYHEVSMEDAQPGDVWIKIKSNGKGHTELVSEASPDGVSSPTFIGSNNIIDANGNVTDVQKVSERQKNISEIQKGVFLHKDFSAEELNQIADELEEKSISLDSGFGNVVGDYDPNTSSASGANGVEATNANGLRGNTQKEQAWNYMKDTMGLSDNAIAGIMGNMAVESGYSSNNVQDSYEDKVGSDQSYTAGVDNGTISRDSFAHDGAGYGLVQYTWSGYKEGLYDMAKERGTSISDLKTQIDYLSTQLSPELMDKLNSATSPEQAAVIFEQEFEKAGVPALEERKAYAAEAYNQFVNGAADTTGLFGATHSYDPTTAMTPGATGASNSYDPNVAGISSNGYSGYPSSGGYSASPAGGGYSGYPSSGGYSASPAGGGYSGYPSSGGYSASPASGGYSGYPSYGDYSASPAGGASSVSPSGQLEGNSQQEQIWNYLHQLGLNDIAAAGIMGNMAQESGYASNNVQNSYEGKVGSDQAYTAGVDNGSISRDSFAHDGAGYGLVQFTYSGYKEGLYDMAKSRGTSVSDIGTQLDFLASQMNTGLIQKLNSAGTPQEAARIFEVEFEKAGTPNMAQREAYASQAYNQFANA